MSEYLEFGSSLAIRAGEIMQSERDGYLDIRQKPDKTLVTKVDLVIQDLAIDEIIRSFPGHAIIGEERTYGSPDAEHIWRIDPLDGTGEHIEGGDPESLSYGFGLAKQRGNVLEAGLFFNPSKGELYTAANGLGAFLNGQRIRVSQDAFKPGIAYADMPGSTCPLNLLKLFQEPGLLFPAYADKVAYKPGDFPVAEAFFNSAIKLPVDVYDMDEYRTVLDEYVAIIGKTLKAYRK